MEYNFKKNKFTVIKKAVDSKIANFVYNYFLMKRQIAKTFFEERYVSEFNLDHGYWNDPQAPNTYSHYADTAMETLLLFCQSIIEEKTNLKLLPTYSYARLYKKGDELLKHKDRYSCEISATMNLGGNPWPIFLDCYGKEIKITLKPGDMLLYKGGELEHWREPFEGNDCAQVFLHYNNSKTKGSKENIFDGRKHLGLPAWFKK
tara:strand:- start:1231 stop:1842 length:612 start_codon:yes stop_codon:yes gene_type:complete